MIGFQAEVGNLVIQRRAVRSHRMQQLLAVGALQQRAIAVARQPCQLRRHADMQMHHKPTCADALAVVRIQHRAATGGNQFVVLFQQRLQGVRLMLPKPGFAMLREDRRDAAAHLFDDGLVHIDELQPEALGQATAYAAFSGAHRADHHEIGCGVHAQGS